MDGSGKKVVTRFYQGDCHYYGGDTQYMQTVNSNINIGQPIVTTNSISSSSSSPILFTGTAATAINERGLSGLNLETITNRRKLLASTGNNGTTIAATPSLSSNLTNMNGITNAHHNQHHNIAAHHSHLPTIPLHPHSMVPSTSNTQIPSNQFNLPSSTNTFQASYFLSDEIKLELLRKQSLMLNEPPLPEVMVELPEIVDTYHELYPLEAALASPSPSIGLLGTSTYRATHLKTGEIVCLRRVHSFPLTAMSKTFVQIIETWKKVQHANIVQLRQVFSTKAFGDSSLVFVYDYYPGAQTMLAQCFNNPMTNSPATVGGASNANASMNGISSNARPYSQQMSQRHKLVPEHTLWAYIIQISSALRTLHSYGLACRAVDPTKILITSGFSTDMYQQSLLSSQHLRVRLSCPGLVDIVFHEAFLSDTQNINPKIVIAHYQEEDLVNFGKICLAMICNSLQVLKRGENLNHSLDLLQRNYSADLRSLILYLMSPKNGAEQKSINNIMPMIGARFYAQLDFTYTRLDILENELTKELDNERLFRLICKLGSINERYDLRLDTQWSETGDRYLLKLFRDYLFHQISDDGQPWLDVAHIVTALNKLDAGSPEKICLLSRDNQNVLIVSFTELKKCLETAFSELLM